MPNNGEELALIEIPRINVTQAVISGVTVEDLKKGPGHFRTTPMPGQLGNAAIAGHRTTWGAPFSRINELEDGDEIVITNLRNERFVYRVSGQKIVPPTDVSVLNATPEPTLTLISCHPKLSATNRIIVTALLDPAASSAPVTAATPMPVEPTATTLPVDEPVATSVGTGGPEPTDVSATATTIDELIDNELADQTEDGFSQGWFDEPEAWPQVALWGTALSAIAILAWMLSRKTKRNLIGLAVGLAPFALALYFFYENANRLLPPNL
jgi:sortase A